MPRWPSQRSRPPPQRTGAYEHLDDLRGRRRALRLRRPRRALGKRGEILGRAAGRRSGWRANRCAAAHCSSRSLVATSVSGADGLHGAGGPLAPRARLRRLAGRLSVADRAALRAAARRRACPIVMADSVDHLDLMRAVRRPAGSGLHRGRLAGGRSAAGSRSAPAARRSARPSRRAALARRDRETCGIRAGGVMGYEAHIAGVGDRPLGKPLRRR